MCFLNCSWFVSTKRIFYSKYQRENILDLLKFNISLFQILFLICPLLFLFEFCFGIVILLFSGFTNLHSLLCRFVCFVLCTLKLVVRCWRNTKTVWHEKANKKTREKDGKRLKITDLIEKQCECTLISCYKRAYSWVCTLERRIFLALLKMKTFLSCCSKGKKFAKQRQSATG